MSQRDLSMRFMARTKLSSSSYAVYQLHWYYLYGSCSISAIFPHDSLCYGSLQVSIEGLQALKPRLTHQNAKSDSVDNKVEREMKSLDKVGSNGLDVEVGLVVVDNNDMMAKWIPENIKFSVKEPVNLQKKKFSYCVLIRV